MKRIMIFLVVASLAACSQAPTPRVSNSTLTPERLGTKRLDSGFEVAADKKRNAVYVVGNTGGSLDGRNLGGLDTFLRRYERDGQLAWSRQFGSPADDYVDGVAVDEGRGFVYVARTRYEPKVAFVYKYNSSGKQLWKHKMVVEGDSELGLNAITVDKRGYIYVAGAVDAGFGDGFVQKLDGNERVSWTIDTPNYDVRAYTSALVTDDARNIYASIVSVDDDRVQSILFKFNPRGDTLVEKSLTFDNGSFDEVVVSNIAVSGTSLYLTGNQGLEANNDFNGYSEGFVAKFSLNGKRTWVQGLSSQLSPSAISADGSGNTFITGRVSQTNFEDSDAFLRSFDPQGRIRWTRRYASPQDDGGNDVLAYSSSEIYLTGFTDGSIGGGKNRGGTDAFLRRTNGSGTPVWTDQ